MISASSSRSSSPRRDCWTSTALSPLEVVDGEERRRLVLDQRLLLGLGGGDDHQQVVVHLARLGVDRGLVRAPVEQEAPALVARRDLVGRHVAPGRAELDLGQRQADLVDVLGPWPGGSLDIDSGPRSGRRTRPGRRAPSRPRPSACLPCGLTSPEPDGVGAGADEDGVLGHLEDSGREVGVGLGRDRADLDPLARRRWSRRPGTGVQARIWRSTAPRPAGSSRSRASSTVIFGAKLTPVGRLLAGLQRAVLDAVEGGDQQPGAALGQPRQQVAGGVGRAGCVSVITPNVGPASSSLTIRNVVAPVTSSPAQMRVLHRRRPAPGGQHREVQVDPAVLRGCRAPTAGSSAP